MIRVLHVIEQEADFQTQRCVEHLTRNPGQRMAASVQVIGNSTAREFLAALRALRQARDFDLVHAWGTRALTAAVLGTGTRIAYTPAVDIGRQGVRWLTAILAHRQVQVICPGGSLQRTLVERGVPAEKCQVIRPGVEFGRIRRRRNPELRSALGLSDQDYVLLAAGESTRGACHEDAVWATGILHKLDPRYKLLLWGRGQRIEVVKRFHHEVGDMAFIRVAEEQLKRRMEFEELLPATDLIVNSATGSVALLPIQIAMAAAMPIVSTATYTASELLEDHHSALMVPKRTPRVLAQRILELREDSSMQWTLADTARAEAYEYFPLTRFLEEYREMYQRLVEEKPVAATASGASGSTLHSGPLSQAARP